MRQPIFYLVLIVIIGLFSSCKSSQMISQADIHLAGLTLDNWHNAASHGDSLGFFGLMTNDAIYLGTDESERWTRTTMIRDLGKYFRDKQAWKFTGSKNILHFDEILSTWMGPCRGSGLLQKVNGKWYIRFYNLANLVPNDVVKDYINLLPPDKILSE